MAQRLPIVGVMGSGSTDFPERTGPLGEWLGRSRVHLLTGGGEGVMRAVSRAFYETPGRAGLVIGIIPGVEGGSEYFPKGGYPNPWVEVPIYTHLPLSGPDGEDPRSRNHINVLTADVLIALPGGAGTASEVHLARRFGRPLVAFLSSRAEIPGLAPETLVESDLSGVRQFVETFLVIRHEGE